MIAAVSDKKRCWEASLKRRRRILSSEEMLEEKRSYQKEDRILGRLSNTTLHCVWYMLAIEALNCEWEEWTMRVDDDHDKAITHQRKWKKKIRCTLNSLWIGKQFLERSLLMVMTSAPSLMVIYLCTEIKFRSASDWMQWICRVREITSNTSLILEYLPNRLNLYLWLRDRYIALR